MRLRTHLIADVQGSPQARATLSDLDVTHSRPGGAIEGLTAYQRFTPVTAEHSDVRTAIGRASLQAADRHTGRRAGLPKAATLRNLGRSGPGSAVDGGTSRVFAAGPRTLLSGEAERFRVGPAVVLGQRLVGRWVGRIGRCLGLQLYDRAQIIQFGAASDDLYAGQVAELRRVRVRVMAAGQLRFVICWAACCEPCGQPPRHRSGTRPGSGILTSPKPAGARRAACVRRSTCTT